jgi:hypothetical protein
MTRSGRMLVLAVSLTALTAATPSRAPAAQRGTVQTESSSGSQLLTDSEIVNLPTGQRSIIDILQTVPGGWEPFQPPPVPGVAPGATVSFPPGQEPLLYDDPSSGQMHWVVYGAQPQSGWIKLLPETSPAPPLPASLAPPATTSATTPTAPSAATPQVQTTKQTSTDYGAGSRTELDTDSAGSVFEGRVYDPNNNLRDDTTYQYANYNGKEIRTSSYQWDFDPKHHLSFTLGLKYNVRGDLTFSDFTNFGLHGERTSEEVTNYRTDGYELKDWKIGTHAWSYTFHTYKLPATSGSSTTSLAPVTPSNFNIGSLFPLDYRPGGTYLGSLWPSTYADNFKTVPGLSEYDSSIQTYTLPDGTPEWCRFKIGVPGYGYSPVRANGTFSLHIPLDWKGALSLQTLQIDPLPNLGASSATFQIGNPVAAPTLTNDIFPTSALGKLDHWAKMDLIDLWNETYDVESWLASAYSAAKPDWEDIYYAEEYLDYLYGEIDYVEDDLPASAVAAFAHNLASDARNYQSWLSNQPNLTSGDQDELADSKGWSSFLDGESNYAASWAAWGPSTPVIQPFWTNPVLTQGKLGALRGDFVGDPFDTQIRIGNFPLTPIGATPTEWYFMPLTGFGSGLSNYTINSPLFGETVFPLFYMTLDMGAGQLNLHKGQSTTYFARLNIFNGSNSLFPSLFDGPPLYETDIIGSSELATNQQAAPASRTGFITFSVTNMSPGTVAMQNQFRVLDASGFVPSGSNEIDGTITATRDGAFSLLGVGRANLAPVGGIGSSPGSSTPSQGYSTTNWLPSFNISHNTSTLSSSPFMTNCSAPAIPAPSTPGASTPTAATAMTTPSTTAGTSTTTPTTTTPATPTGASTPSDCPPAALIDLYNDATGNPTSEPVGNPPSTSDIDAAKKRVDDAKAKLKKTADNRDQASFRADILLGVALAKLPQSDRDYLQKFGEKRSAALLDYIKMNARVRAHSTTDNEKYWDEAWRHLQEANEEYEAAERYIIDQFSPADRAAWQAAQAALDQAQRDNFAASEELHEAESALGKVVQSAAIK